MVLIEIFRLVSQNWSKWPMQRYLWCYDESIVEGIIFAYHIIKISDLHHRKSCIIFAPETKNNDNKNFVGLNPKEVKTVDGNECPSNRVKHTRGAYGLRPRAVEVFE